MGRDDVEKRASEIRARVTAAEQEDAALKREMERARLALVSHFSAALAERTPHIVECLALEPSEEEHGALVRFHFVRGERAGVLAVGQIGVDLAEGHSGARVLTYYFQPNSSAFEIEVEHGFKGTAYAPMEEVIETATGVTIEMMATVVADGGKLGSAAQVVDLVNAAKRERRARASADQRRGCLIVVATFLGLCFLVGLLNNFSS